MWFFAVLIVLALGGVAVVAAGRGAPLEPVHDDRPDALVPAAGLLSAADIRQVRFSLAFRGYRMSEVDALLDRLAREREAPAPGEASPVEDRRGEDSPAGSGVEETPPEGNGDAPTA